MENATADTIEALAAYFSVKYRPDTSEIRVSVIKAIYDLELTPQEAETMLGRRQIMRRMARTMGWIEAKQAKRKPEVVRSSE